MDRGQLDACPRVGHLLADARGRVMHASSEAAQLLRQPVGALVGRPLDALVSMPPQCECGPPSSLAGDRPRMHPVQALRQGDPALHFDMHVEPLEGDARLWLVQLTQRSDPSMDGPLLDALTRCAGLCWAEVDRHGILVRTSEGFAQHFGDGHGSLPATLASVFDHPDLDAAVHAAIDTHEARELPALPRIPPSSCSATPPSYWNVSVQPVTGTGGEDGALLALRDVSHELELRKRLDTKVQLMSEMLHSAPDAICITTRERVLLANKLARELLGDLQQPTEIYERVRPVDGQSLEWFALARPEEAWLTPIECTVDDGLSRREVLVFTRPITFDGHAALLFAIRDCTSERKLERQLLRSKKLEALGHISASISHEFGNLLTLLAFDAEQARVARDLEDQRLLLEAISQTTERSQQLVREVMRFTREGSPDALVDLAESVRRLRPILERSIGDGRELTFDVPAGPMVAPLAAVHVEQILLNLLLNARDATSEGDAIHVEVRPGEGATAEIHVRDRGRGMSDEISRRVFEPFFTTKQALEGSGLGLALVGDVVRRAGGSVHFDSTLGEGTHFVVRLPTAADVSAPRTVAGRAHGTERVAICYPDETLCDAMVRSLSLLGYDALGCPACQRQWIESDDSIEAWIMHVTQYDALQPELSQRDPRRRLRVLCIGEADGSEPPRSASDSSTSVEVLRKPFTPLELALALRRCLD